MTAEVAVLNKHAIALAADSAATVQSTGKIYSANKLLALSKRRPVGAMVYNASEFLGIPWESLIKRFRADRPRRTHDTMREWVDEFCRYLDVVTQDVPNEVKDQDAVFAYARALANVITRARKSLNATPGKISKDVFFPAIEQALSELIKDIVASEQRGALKKLVGCEESVSSFVERNSSNFDEVDTHVFSEHVDEIPTQT